MKIQTSTYVTRLNKAITDMESIFGLHKNSELPLASRDFKDIRTLMATKFKTMPTDDKKVYWNKLTPSLESLIALSFQCGFLKISLIDTSALSPIDNSMKMFSIYSSYDALTENKNYINTVINYFSNKLVSLDNETIQNKNGACYRLQRLFILFNMVGFSIGCGGIANFILMNLRGSK